MGDLIMLSDHRTVDQAWKRFCSLHNQARDHPHLANDPAHTIKRAEAAQEFKRLFDDWVARTPPERVR